MRKASVMGEAYYRPLKAPEYIKVRSFGGERHRRGGQRRLAIESSAGEYCAGEEVRNWFQIKVLT